MTDSSAMVLLYVPCPSQEHAQDLSRELLRHHLIVCANIIPPSHSYYLWQGVIEQSTESLVMMKTLSCLEQQARALIQKQHPYEQPVILTLPIITLSQEVQEWAEKELLAIEKKNKI